MGDKILETSPILYIYAMTHDTGFAPCVQNNLLTLACCKGGTRGGMRKSAANAFLAGNDVYLLGLCGESLAKIGEMKYRPVYLAKIDSVIEMTEYYAIGGRAAGRKDGVYKVVNGELKAKKNNRHSEYDRAKDKGGQYVLCSSQFAYWGGKCGESGHEIEDTYGYIFRDRTSIDGKKGIRDRRGFRGYIIEEHLAGFKEALSKWDWFPAESGKSNIISNRSIGGDLLNGCGGCGK